MYIYDKKICFLAINFGYLLVSELAHEGLKGLKILANFEKLFINSHCEFGKKKLYTIKQGAKIANVPGLASCILQFCNFNQCNCLNMEGDSLLSYSNIFQIFQNAMHQANCV